MTPLPSTSALRAFEAAGRLLSFTRAADELRLTQSAISHQIRDLETQLATRLFHRRGRGLSLTDAGERYLPFVREGLDRLRVGTEAITAGRSATVLTVSVSPNFATKWLVPRLGLFLEAHPDLDLRISATMRHVDFLTDDIDVAIRHGEGDWPHLDVTRLCTEAQLPVCSPALLRDGPPLTEVADLGRHVLLHDQDFSGWRRWLERVCVSGADAERGPVFNQASLAIDAAVAGQGVALARSALAALDLAAGRLVRPLPLAVPAPFAYWIVGPKASADEPKITRFRNWLLEQAAGDEAAF
jgi:LysR family glycine cleavage system transcriptional activator